MLNFLKSFSGKLVASGIITTVAIFSFSIYSFTNINALSDSQDEVNNVIDDIPWVLFSIQSSFLGEANLLSSLNSGLITPAAFREKWEASEQKEEGYWEKLGGLAEKFGHIRFLSAQERTFSAKMKEALNAIQTSDQDMKDSIQRIAAAYEMNDAGQEAALQNHINDLRDRFKSRTDSLNLDINDLLNARADYARSIVQRTLKSSFFFLSFVFILTVWLNMHLILQMISSLRAILKGIESSKRGDLAYRIKLPGGNEFGTIAESFNEAASHIQEAQEKLQATTKRAQEQAAELAEKNDRLERFRKITVGRELKMIELKKELEELKKRHGTS